MSIWAARHGTSQDCARHGPQVPDQARHAVPPCHASNGHGPYWWPKHGTTCLFLCRSSPESTCKLQAMPVRSPVPLRHLYYSESKFQRYIQIFMDLFTDSKFHQHSHVYRSQVHIHFTVNTHMLLTGSTKKQANQTKANKTKAKREDIRLQTIC